MSISIQEEDRIISLLFQSFNQNSMVLFVGKGASENDLSPQICELPWNCVVTDRCEEGFGSRFVTETRKPKEYCLASEFPANLFDRGNLPIIRLYGVEGILTEGEEEEEIAQMRRKKECDKMLSIVMGKLDVLGCMVVVGYNPSIRDELPRVSFMLSWEESHGGFFFFGISADDDQGQKLKDAALKRGYNWCDVALTDMLGRYEGEENDIEKVEVRDSSDINLFYKGNKPATISASILLRYRSLAELLTEEKIYQIRPYGRIQQSRWFYNFLTRSSHDGPQWYGYLPSSEFYVKRSFEDTLVNLVRNILFGKEMAGQGYSTPVILEGDPGSSKSITLGALAYRIYNEKICPVIFIHNAELNNQDLEELDQMMQEIEQVGESDTRILLIWDGSAYCNVTKTACDIARQLDNRGRRFVLVCSSYRNTGIEKADAVGKIWYRMAQDGDYVRCRKTEHEIVLEGNCYFIHAIREMNASERFRLKQKVKEYAVREADNLSKIWKRLESEGRTSTFDYFYELIILLQPQLEQGLSREQRKISQYVQEQLDKLRYSGKNEQVKTVSPMVLALRKAGIISEELEEAIEKEDSQDSYDLSRFNLGVAIFSRFKLEAPSSLVLKLLYTGKQENEREFYSYANRMLFNQITTSIPWILYKENGDGIFYFCYRNVLEAEIFLKKNQIDVENQVAIVCDMLNYYAQNYREFGFEDPIIKQSLQRLLRILGPNSDYIPFQRQESNEHSLILQRLNIIIDKLGWLRKVIQIPDEDASFAVIEVTFMREYYSALWGRLKGCSSIPDGFCAWEIYPDIYTEESYCERLNYLCDAANLANASIDKLECLETDNSGKRQLASQINSLTVEFTYCNMRLEELWKEYSKLCKSKGQDTILEWKTIRPMPYLPQYRMLVKTINSDPLNGYAYNALFTLFEKEYKKSGEERRLQLLSEIQVLLDDASTLNIHNRGALDRDELGKHIVNIAQYSSDTRVTIQSILDGTCQKVFADLFTDMLYKDSPAAIIFVCQQELENAGLSGRRAYGNVEGEAKEKILDERQLQVCNEVQKFMQRKEYASCVEKDPHALYLLLRVLWMCYNKRPLLDGGECRLTYIEHENWIEILRICQLYEECAGNNRRPLAVLIHALSIVQVSGDYVAANSMLESLSESAFYTTARLRVPYMICDETGTPKLYSGTVISTKEYRGLVKVDKIPRQLGSKSGIRFYLRNLGLRTMPKEREILNSLEMGIGYTGFSLYKAEGRKRLEER